MFLKKKNSRSLLRSTSNIVLSFQNTLCTGSGFSVNFEVFVNQTFPN